MSAISAAFEIIFNTFHRYLRVQPWRSSDKPFGFRCQYLIPDGILVSGSPMASSKLSPDASGHDPGIEVGPVLPGLCPSCNSSAISIEAKIVCPSHHKVPAGVNSWAKYSLSHETSGSGLHRSVCWWRILISHTIPTQKRQRLQVHKEAVYNSVQGTALSLSVSCFKHFSIPFADSFFLAHFNVSLLQVRKITAQKVVFSGLIKKINE